MSRDFLCVCLAVFTTFSTAACGGDSTAEAVDRTVATVEPVRSSVTIGSGPAVPVSRIAPGDAVETSEAGLVRVSLDGGANLLVGDAGRIVVNDADAVELASGRLFAATEGGQRLSIHTARGRVGTSDGALSIRISDGDIAVYVVRGEVGFSMSNSNGVVRAGERLLLRESGPEVAPAEVWIDWTGGLARPGPGDDVGPAGMGTLEARVPEQIGTARQPLVVQQLEVRVEIRGDLAVTEIDQVFHNPGNETVEGLYRVRTPEGAVLQRFAIDRDGQLMDAYVRERHQAKAAYRAQVYRGSTEDPALLEWDAPGAYRARIYPIGPGQQRRIVVRYAEWLTGLSNDAVRLYRYPMGQGARPPYIENFSLTVDLSEANASQIRAGMGSTVEGTTVRLRRNDFRPRADFWLELGARGGDSSSYSAYRAKHTPPRRAPNAPAPVGEEDERDYFFFPLVLPTTLAEGVAERPGGFDVVVVADVSAATDPSHLELGQSMVEAIATHMGQADRIAVVASDLTLRAVVDDEGGGELGPASLERLERLLTGLARLSAGGATDLGAAITAAGDLLDPERRGAIVYIGDGAPTVGELQTADLLERMARLPSHARLYAVAVGSDANLDLLSALTRGRGLSTRIEERRAAAETSMRFLAHLSRPMARAVTVDLGTGIETVYPAGPADVLLGDVLPVLGRVGETMPTVVRVTGTIDGQDFAEELSLRSESIEDSGDLRLRWSGERLRHLLIEGVPRETIVELGTRYGLITPYTSFYVPSAREAMQTGYSRLLVPLDVESRSTPTNGDPVTSILASALMAPLGMLGCSLSAEDESAVASAGQRALAEEYNRNEDVTRGVSSSSSQSVHLPTPAVSPTEPSTAEPEEAAEEESPPPAIQPPSPPQPGVVSTNSSSTTARPAENGPGSGGGAARNGQGLDSLLDGALGGGEGARPRRSRVENAPIKQSLANPGDCESCDIAPDPAAGKIQVFGRGGAESDERSRRVSRRRVQAKRSSASLEKSSTPARPEPTVEEGRRRRQDEQNAEAERETVTVAKNAHLLARCSSASELPLGDRRSLWSERLGKADGSGGWIGVYRRAIRDCEATSWRDRRALLDLIVRRAGTMERIIAVHNSLANTSAAPYLRQSILARVRTPADLVPIRAAFGGGNVEWRAIEERLGRDEDVNVRIAFLRDLVTQHPGSFDLRLRLISALEQSDRIPEALRLAQELRADRLADAEVRTAVGELLLRHDHEAEARRVFSEMVEFSPYDALARRRLGDLYRAHRWFDDAYRQYQTLAEIRPDDPTVQFLLAAAAAGAGRVDEALRLERSLSESPEPGASGGLARVAVYSSSARLAKLRRAAREENDEEQLRILTSRMRRSAVLREASAFRVTLNWAHPHAGLSLWGSHPNLSLSRPPDVWPDLGIEVFDVEDLESGEYRLEVRRERRDMSTQVEAELVIVWNEGQAEEQIVVVPLRFEGEQRVLAWTINGRDLQEASPTVASGEEVL